MSSSPYNQPENVTNIILDDSFLILRQRLEVFDMERMGTIVMEQHDIYMFEQKMSYIVFVLSNLF